MNRRAVPVVAALVGVFACGGWPPVVRSVSDVQRLPADQREIRCVACGPAEIEAIARKLRGLDYLFLNSESAVTDSGVRSIASIPTLRQIVFTDASKISDAGVASLAAMQSLRELMLYDASGLSDRGLLELSKAAGLTMLYVSGAAVSAAAVQELRRRLPNCTVRVDEPEANARGAAQQGDEADKAR